MCKLRFTLFTGLLLAMLHITAQGGGYIYVADSTPMFFVNGKKIYSPDKSTQLYFLKGNTFFKGLSEAKDNIYLMVTSTRINARWKTNYIYENDSMLPVHYFRDYQFFFNGPYGEDIGDVFKRYRLLYVKTEGNRTCFYSSLDKSLLGYYVTDSVSEQLTVFAAYEFIKKHNLEVESWLKKNQTTLPAPVKAEEPVIGGTIKPLMGNVSGNEWIWDGKLFYPKANNDSAFVWRYYSSGVMPAYNYNSDVKYVWTDNLLKPETATGFGNQWQYNEKAFTFTPLDNNSGDLSRQYVIDNDKIRTMSGMNPEKEWRLSGIVPIPLIILVVSGMLQPN